MSDDVYFFGFNGEVNGQNTRFNVQKICSKYWNHHRRYSEKFMNEIISPISSRTRSAQIHPRCPRGTSRASRVTSSVTGRFAHGQFAQNDPPKVRLG